MSRKLLVIFPLLFIFSFEVAAEPKTGRLPSGQAYRTDAAGNQIVDYIAELEVKNEALERRIRGLVNEVEDLRASGGSPSRSLREKNLLGSSSQYKSKKGTFAPVAVVPSSSSESKKSSSQVESKKPLPRASCGERECEIFISEVRTRGNRALEKQKAALKEASEKAKVCDQQFEAFKVAMDAHEREEADILKELSQAKLQASAREDLLSQRQAEISTKDKELSSLKRKVDTLESELIRLKGVEASLRTANQQLKIPPKSPPAVASSKKAKVAPASVTRASLSTRALSDTTGVTEARRARVKSLYSSIIQLRNKRDKMFKTYNSSTLSIKKKSVRTKSGKMPEQLLGLVKSTNSSREMYLLEKEGKRLEKIVKSDISVINRMRN